MTNTSERDSVLTPESRVSSVGLPTTIVVGVDGSPESDHATRWVAQLAASLGARVVLIHATTALSGILNDSLPLKTQNWRQRERLRIHQEWAQPLRELGVEHRTRLVEKTPGTAILDAAREEHADLIAIGIHRKHQVHSLSAHLSHHASCPVVTIPSRAPRSMET